MSDPRKTYPDPEADEKDWPLGMGPDGELNIVDDPEAEDENEADDGDA